MDINSKIISLLRNIGVVTHYKLKKDQNGNSRIIYYMVRNLTEEEASFLRSQNIPVTSRSIHKGLSTMYQINNNVRTGKNHPFITKSNGQGMTDCFDPNSDHIEVDDTDVYNICKEEYYLRKCQGINTDACKWLRDRIIAIKTRNKDVYNYNLVRDTFPMPPVYYGLSYGKKKRKSKKRSKRRSKRKTG